MNARFQIAVHILTLLHHAKGELYPSEFIAGSINANAALVRKELSNLRKHGLVESKEGKTGGYALGRPAELITLADVYAAIKSVTPFGLAKNQPNPDCPVGKQVNKHVMALYRDVDQSISKHLFGITLADFSKNFD
ncbi:RrF2 family transcriptional regulator [Mucilaginibacter agri]|uniref:Transcriptional regulator n=1 Tax=Mucilaginibacter agri TaxID=2695265 RepID=A0A965ZFP8_9SPHI|nr:Rrf2 family transcriptional regulator [Mucilaginibacter agri]NCD68942.1 transcriptional regulator [Mucilaginibacter agri]